MRTLHSGDPREPARGLKGTHGRRALRLGQRADEPGQDLSLGPVQDGVEMGGERGPEELRGDVGVSGAARMGKQAGVIRLRRRRRVDPEPVSEPARDQRGVQPVLEREPHAEVGRQAQGPDHLRGADLLGALGRLV